MAGGGEEKEDKILAIRNKSHTKEENSKQQIKT